MAVIWLDSAVIGDIADGDRDLEIVVKSSGSPLLMTPKVREELRLGNPLKEGAVSRSLDGVARAVAVIQRLGIQVDLMGSQAAREELFIKQFKFKKDRTVVVRLKNRTRLFSPR